MDKFKARSAVLLTIIIIMIIARPGEPEAEADMVERSITSHQTSNLTPEPTIMVKRHRGVGLTSKVPTVKLNTTAQQEEAPQIQPKKVEALIQPVERSLQKMRYIGNTIWMKRECSAYNAGDPEQCGNDKGLGSDGTDILRGLAQGKKYVAANFVPLGSWLEIRDSVKSLGFFQVVDKTSKKYGHRVDIAFPREAKEAALEFGRQDLFVRLVDKKLVRK